MHRKPHPDFENQFKILFFKGFATFVVIFGAILALDHFHFDRFAKSLIIPFLLFAFGFMAFMFLRMHAIKCPDCGQKTKLIKDVKEAKYLAQCEKCKIDWDIGIGIGD